MISFRISSQRRTESRNMSAFSKPPCVGVCVCAAEGNVCIFIHDYSFERHTVCFINTAREDRRAAAHMTVLSALHQDPLISCSWSWEMWFVCISSGFFLTIYSWSYWRCIYRRGQSPCGGPASLPRFTYIGGYLITPEEWKGISFANIKEQLSLPQWLLNI